MAVLKPRCLCVQSVYSHLAIKKLNVLGKLNIQSILNLFKKTESTNVVDDVTQEKKVIDRAIIILLAVVVGVGVYMFTGKNDTPVEQASETVLRGQGVEVDFSPND